ncbi:unnamed protein product [Schistocephalus solidus]|uniref:Cadherin domain-containing protein n=1 Tax=Schistocephalus solidus TaxID=70667 RepID=A0A183SD56_SCHSO|nr:unnamed protein product [Schistocephalus solidus]
MEKRQVIVVDPDAGINGSVQYFLASQKSFTQEASADEDALKLATPTNRESQLFELDRRRGTLSLKHELSEADVGQVFRLHIIASDMAASPLQSDSILMVQVDRSEPRGEVASRKWASAGFGAFGKNISDSMINFFIIIFIVVAAFIISAVLLTAVCLVLRKPRRNINNPHISRTYCTSVSELPVSFSGPNNFAMSSTGKLHAKIAIMTDYVPEDWVSDPSTLPNSESVLYARMTPTMLQCVADRNRYLRETEAEHTHIYAYGGNSSCQSAEGPVAAVELTDSAEMQYASLGMASGRLGAVTVSAGAGLAFSTSPFVEYSFPRRQNTGTACNVESVAWIDSQDIFSGRPETYSLHLGSLAVSPVIELVGTSRF